LHFGGQATAVGVWVDFPFFHLFAKDLSCLTGSVGLCRAGATEHKEDSELQR
jgi:hypothetical protein